MAEVSKSATDTSHGNTVTLHTLKIMFQVFPGVKGTDAQRGIPNVPYTVKIGKTGTLTTGKTAADGGVTLTIPSNAVATLTIFETKYLVSVKKTIEALTTTKGAQRRLGYLGYELGEVDGQVGPLTDLATLNFQADSNLNADGAIDTNTQNQLRTDFGE